MIKNCEKFLCRLYKDLSSESLDNIRIRTPLISSKPKEKPLTSYDVSFHIMHSIFQASIWKYAYLPYQSELPSAIDSGGTTLIKNGKMCPIMRTLEPMPDEVEENDTSNCVTMCANKMCSCRSRGNKCALLCNKAQIFT